MGVGWVRGQYSQGRNLERKGGGEGLRAVPSWAQVWGAMVDLLANRGRGAGRGGGRVLRTLTRWLGGVQQWF